MLTALRFADGLGALSGYYTTTSVVLLMAFMLLARAANPERLGYQSPSDWGGLPDLDRCPAPDGLRRKIAALADLPDAVRNWLLALASYCYGADIEVQAALFFDGHVTVYTGRHPWRSSSCPASGSACRRPPAEPTLTLVFDREGWSPEMFLGLWARCVARVIWIKGAGRALAGLRVRSGGGAPAHVAGRRQPALVITHPSLPAAEAAGLLR